MLIIGRNILLFADRLANYIQIHSVKNNWSVIWRLPFPSSTQNWLALWLCNLQFCAGTVYYLTSHYCYISMHNSFWERKTNSILENSIKIDQIIYSRVVSTCWICWRSLCSVLCFLDIIMSIGFSQWISRHSLFTVLIKRLPFCHSQKNNISLNFVNTIYNL